MHDQLTWIRTALAPTPARWHGLVASVPDELIRRDPAPGEWSALRCLAHLVETEEAVFQARLAAILAGHDLASYDPDADGTAGSGHVADARALADRFVVQRRAGLERIGAVKGTDLGRTARHAQLGMVTLGELLNQWAAHDLMHTIQGERALMQPFLAASGPWRFYFADHDAEHAPATVETA